MTVPTEHLMELIPQARDAEDEDLLRILRAGNEMYHEGLESIREEVARECAGLSDVEIAERRQFVGAPESPGGVRSREADLRAIAFVVWGSTPAAMAFDVIAEHAAQKGVSILPEGGP